MLKRTILSALLLSISFADNFNTHTSFQGYTGIINIPTANLIDVGKAELSLSNQVGYFDALKKEDYKAEDYIFNIGLLHYLEFGGRLSNIQKKSYNSQTDHGFGAKYFKNDLSANIKFQLPFFNDLNYIPKIAFGIQDLGGAASSYDSKYIVATQQLYFLQATLGYGYASNRLEGIFGGLEVKITDWFYLLAENDTKESQLGLKINTPNNFFKYGDVAFIAKKNLTDKEADYSFGLNFKFNLYKKESKLNKIVKDKTNNINKDYNYYENITLDEPKKSKKITSIIDLKNRLVEFGFENIDIGERNKTIYVAYENHVMEHNELDGVGIVLGYMAFLKKYNTFEIVVKRNNLKIKKIEGDLNFYRDFIVKPTTDSNNLFRKSLKVSTDFETAKYNMKVIDENNGYFKTKLMLSPKLSTFVGTEDGLFDYYGYLQTNFDWNLYKGLNLTFTYDIPISHSDSFDKGSTFSKCTKSKRGSSIDGIMLHKTDIFGNFMNTLSVGSFQKDYLGFINQSVYGFGDSQLKLKIASFKNNEIDEEERRKIILATYNYYVDNIDSLVEITTGQYFYKDKGFDVKFKKYFDDVAVCFFYQNADSNQYAGMGVEIPLTFRKYKKSKYWDIRGVRNFSYCMRTTIRRDDGSNRLVPYGAKKVYSNVEINSYYLNRDRFKESYFKKHILRLRYVYFRYIKNKIY